MFATARGVVGATHASWREDRTIRLGAGLAYYGLFATVPVVTLTAALAGAIFSLEDVQAYLSDGLERILQGDTEAVAVAATEQLASADVQAGLGVIGAVTLLISGSLVFVALQDALNVIWDLPVGTGMRYTIRRYALGFLVVMLIVAVQVAAMAVQAISGILGSLTDGERDALVRVGSTAASWALGAGALALVFRVLTGKRVGRVPALKGATVTALAGVIGTFAIGWYLSRFATASVSGAVGAISVVLVWIYYEAQILLVGAQLTKVLEARVEAKAADRGTRA